MKRRTTVYHILMASACKDVLCTCTHALNDHDTKSRAALAPQEPPLMWVAMLASTNTCSRRPRLELRCKRLSWTSTPWLQAEDRDSSLGLKESVGFGADDAHRSKHFYKTSAFRASVIKPVQTEVCTVLQPLSWKQVALGSKLCLRQD